MTERKFTAPEEFHAEYFDWNGNKVTILGRGPHEVFPFIGHNAAGHARYWTEEGNYSSLGISGFDIYDIPKRITTWHNVYSDRVTRSTQTQAEADAFASSNRLCVYRIERDEDGGNFKMFKEEV